MKKFCFIFLLSFFLCASILAEDTIWNRIFFNDFRDIGTAITADPIKTGCIAAGFGTATYLLMKNDFWLSGMIRSGQNNFKDNFFNIFSMAGDGYNVFAADSLLFAFGGEKEKKTAVSIVEGVAVSGAIGYVFKVAFGRMRPSKTDNPLDFKWFNFADNSYPSGHTLVAFTWATIIGDRYGIGWITYPAATLTAFARIYKKAHWPSDVLFGAVIGVITAKVINFADEKWPAAVVPTQNGAAISLKF